MIVPSGAHTVTMRYRPASAIAGGLLSLIGAAVAAFVATRRQKVALKEQENVYAQLR